jgi:hypothetical protein
VCALLASTLASRCADIQTGQVYVLDVRADAQVSNGGVWAPLKSGTTLNRGARIRTGDDSTVDLVLQYNGSVLRLAPDSELHFDKLNKQSAGDDLITETSLNLVSGSLIGSQRKLATPSTFAITIPGGVATIKGTEYLVRSDGAVTCLSGSVTVIYNLPGNGGSVKVTVPAGYSFDPKTGQVVKTTPAFLKNIIADVDTVRNNAQVFKAGGATIVIKPEEAAVTPTKGSKGNNGVGNGVDPQPPGNPPINDGPGTGPGNPGNRQHGNTPGKHP